MIILKIAFIAKSCPSYNVGNITCLLYVAASINDYIKLTICLLRLQRDRFVKYLFRV